MQKYVNCNDATWSCTLSILNIKLGCNVKIAQSWTHTQTLTRQSWTLYSADARLFYKSTNKPLVRANIEK